MRAQQLFDLPVTSLGKMIDYVKCLECGREKSREDTFLDIPLPVRPFGSTVAYGSVVSMKLNCQIYNTQLLDV